VSQVIDSSNRTFKVEVAVVTINDYANPTALVVPAMYVLSYVRRRK
jgi:hypothetical protein